MIGQFITSNQICTFCILFVYLLQKGKSYDEISEELKMDIRTIKKYESNSVVSRGGKVKVQNEEISLFFKEMRDTSF